MRHINFKETSNVRRNDTLDTYLSEMNKCKPLGDDVLRDLIIKAQHGNYEARKKAIEANLRIVWSVAKAYNMADTFEDVLQSGNIGLCMAIDTFDVELGTKFSTWALEMIRKHINIYLTDNSRTVRQSAHYVKAKAAYHSASFDAPLGNEDGDEKTLLDTFASDTRADDLTSADDMKKKIAYLMRGLDEREKAIVCGLFAINCPEGKWTERTLAEHFGMTNERIRQIKWEALRKMKEMA
jgi:RNA polymerase sigma factor (sigma-70 family)